MSKKRSGLGKFLLGAGIGVGLGMLFSPKDGKQNRESLNRKINEFIEKAKTIDSEEVLNNIQNRIANIKEELSDLDKEKALKIAKKKSEEIKVKIEDLIEYVVEKGTPVLEKVALSLKEKTIVVTKEILNKLEQEEK